MNKAYTAEIKENGNNEKFIQSFYENILLLLDLFLELLKADNTTSLIEEIQHLLIEVHIFLLKFLIFDIEHN